MNNAEQAIASVQAECNAQTSAGSVNPVSFESFEMNLQDQTTGTATFVLADDVVESIVYETYGDDYCEGEWADEPSYADIAADVARDYILSRLSMFRRNGVEFDVDSVVVSEEVLGEFTFTANFTVAIA